MKNTRHPLVSLFKLLVGILWLCVIQLPAAAEQVLHRGSIGDPETLDPHRTRSGQEGTIMTDLFSGLLMPGPAGDIVLGSAESWTVSEDGKRYRFRLRDGLKWSDGTALHADDFVYGMQRLMDPKAGSAAASYLAMIVNAPAVLRGELPVGALGVSSLDSRTLIVELDAPTPYFNELLAVTWKPGPRHVIEQYGSDWIKPGNHVSNGPFKLAEWVPSQHVKLIKNEYYFAADSVALDAVFHHPAEDLATSFKRFRAGELDIVTAFPTQQLPWARENLADALHITPTINLEAYLFNTRRPPFDDSRVRLALSMAVDRQLLVDKILRAKEQPAYGIVPPAATNYPVHPQAEFARWPQAERVAKARSLLAEAGYGDANPLAVEIRINASDIRKQLALAVASMWKQIGVTTTLLASEDKARLQDIYTGNYQVAASLRLSGAADAFLFLQPFHSAAGSMNHPGYLNRRYDALLDEAAATVDLGNRAQLLKQAEELLLADHPLAPLYVYSSKKLISPRVRGWQDNPKSINPARYLSLVD